MIRIIEELEEKKVKDKFQISLAAARVNAKMTQEDVAKTMRVGKRTIINWEKGETIPSFADLNMLAAIYEVPIDNIFLPTKST